MTLVVPAHVQVKERYCKLVSQQQTRRMLIIRQELQEIVFLVEALVKSFGFSTTAHQTGWPATSAACVA